MSTWPPGPVTLAGRHATLVPLAAEHAPGLAEASADGEGWRLWYTTVPAPEDVAADIAARLARQAAGAAVPFAVLDASGAPVGMTQYMNIPPDPTRLEIGGTWYAGRVRRTGVNTECKRMLMEHAFTVLGCLAVEFRTHHLNTASRRAIERLGARLDGILRRDRIIKGLVRDTAVYSITAEEWPTVRRHLDWELERPR